MVSFPRDIMFTAMALGAWIYLTVRYHCITEDTMVINIPRQLILGVLLMYVLSAFDWLLNPEHSNPDSVLYDDTELRNMISEHWFWKDYQQTIYKDFE